MMYSLPQLGGRTTSPPAVATAANDLEHDAAPTKMTAASSSSSRSSNSRTRMSSSSHGGVEPFTVHNTNAWNRMSISSAAKQRVDCDEAHNKINSSNNKMKHDDSMMMNGIENQAVFSTAIITTTTQNTPTPAPQPLPLLCWDYPQTIPFPNRALVHTFFEEAMACPINTTNENNNNCSTTIDANNDQIALSDAGLLSFERVILPALAAAEDQALMVWQSRMQRQERHQINNQNTTTTENEPNNTTQTSKALAVALRRTLYSAVAAARRAAHHHRTTVRQVALAQHQDALRHSQTQQRERETSRRFRTAQTNHAANRSVWQEIAMLQTHRAQLTQQEAQWRVALEAIQTHQNQLQQEEMDKQKLAAAATTNLLHQGNEDDAMDTACSSSSATPLFPKCAQVAETARDMILSVERIRQAVTLVLETIVPRTQDAQRAVYQQYVNDNHQFPGYAGVQNPKALLQSLSQQLSQYSPNDNTDDDVEMF